MQRLDAENCPASLFESFLSSSAAAAKRLPLVQVVGGHYSLVRPIPPPYLKPSDGPRSEERALGSVASLYVSWLFFYGVQGILPGLENKIKNSQSS